MSTQRQAIDVSTLPTIVFGHRSKLWWGTAAFMFVETTTLGILVSSYFYLARLRDSWPPAPIPPPDLLPGTLILIVLLVTVPLEKRSTQVARSFELRSLLAFKFASLSATICAALLRIREFRAVNVRWDDNAYGSVVWGLLVFHSALLIVEVFEELLIMGFLASSKREKKHFTDAEDSSFYQYFLVAASVVVYATLYIAPRLI